MQFKHLAVTSAAAIALGLSFSASASVVNFDQAAAQSPTGSVSYDGNGGALVGSGISFGEVSLNGASAPDGHEGTLSCQSCMINFATGDNISEGTTGDLWSFAGGGNLTLDGSAVDSDGNTVADGELFSGTFAANASQPQVVIGNGVDTLNASLSGSDDFNTELANYLGLSTSDSFDFSNTEIALGNATFGDDGSFDSGKLSNADVTVESSSSDVPAPSQFGLFALGLALVLGGLGFRRKQGGSIV